MDNQIALYQQLLNLQSAEFFRIEHHDAMVAVVYKVIESDGNQFILKISDRVPDYLREVHFLKFFADKLPVPKILQIIPPKEQRHGAILMEYLPGALLQPDEFTESLANEIGKCLAIIHQNRLPDYGDPMLGKLDNDPRVYFTFKFEEGLEECRTHLPLTLINKCNQFFEFHIDKLLLVDGPCMAHRDYRPGNLIVNHGKLSGIIDWAGARASFAEDDFCSFEYGEWSKNPCSKNAFLDGYASVRPVPDYNSILPLLRLSKAIATIGFTVKKGTWNSTHIELYQMYRSFLNNLVT